LIEIIEWRINMNIEKEWWPCPVCGKKCVMIDVTKNIQGVYIKCKLCKNEIEIIHEAINKGNVGVKARRFELYELLEQEEALRLKLEKLTQVSEGVNA
jgi:transcription elongation factor Elf1